jgi:hypothetical protein
VSEVSGEREEVVGAGVGWIARRDLKQDIVPACEGHRNKEPCQQERRRFTPF